MIVLSEVIFIHFTGERCVVSVATLYFSILLKIFGGLVQSHSITGPHIVTANQAQLNTGSIQTEKLIIIVHILDVMEVPGEKTHTQAHTVYGLHLYVGENEHSLQEKEKSCRYF